MPTLENLGASLSESETKNESQSATSEPKALAVAKPSLSDTEGNMTKGQALAVAWTGIEALALMKQAKVFRSSKDSTIVWVQFLDTDYTANGGLVVK